jgi:methylmalonyl-CoA/ethylmalonyl-CoA epimerase
LKETSGVNRPFSNRLVHIAVVVRDMDIAIKRLEALGMGPFIPYPFDSLSPLAGKLLFHGKPLEGGGNVKIFTGKMGNVALELFETLEGVSPQKEFLESKGEGIHHIAFGVDDFNGELARFTEKGVSILQIARLVNGGGACYLDIGVGGLIFELEKLV